MNESNSQDMLRAIFDLQESLNDKVFDSNSINTSEGKPLRMDLIRQAVAAGHLAVNDLPNQWLVRYSQAMQAELDELNADLKWKWWSKDSIDLQNIRVELIDILHFLVSAMISAGLTPEQVYRIYAQKHSVNLGRQDSGYSEETKTEDDNRTIE